MSTKKSRNKTTITQQRIKSSKGLLVFCSLIAMLTNIAVVAVLLMNVSEWTFWICPVILLALNTLFLVGSFYSNYRFGYAIRSVWFHIILVLLASISSWVLTWYLESRIVFETIALYALPATHILQCFAVLMTTMHARRKGKLLRRTVTVLTVIAFVVCAGVYGVFLATEGFFGQGFEKEQRVLVYSYDTVNNCYIAEDVLDGRGGTIVIPSEFDGLPVGGLNCELFENEEIKMIHLDCETTVAFQNVTVLSGTREDLELYASKEKIDGFRHALFALRSEDKDTISLANNIIPDDIASNQVYITPQYNEEMLELSNGNILPVWIAQKNTKFNFEEYAKDYDFLKYSNPTSDADLYYCYTQQNGKIFSGVMGENSTSLNGQPIKQSTKINFTFDKVYRVRILEDNDTKYTINENIRFTQTVDGKVEYKFTTADNINTVIGALTERPGFDLAWKVNSRTMQSAKEELAALDALSQDTLTLSPEWSLKQPTITSIKVNGNDNYNSVIYGETVELLAEATAPDSSISIRYEWKKGNTVLSSTENMHQVQNLHPNDAGLYRLTVTAYSDEITSLTSQNVKEANVNFVKKDLNIYWNLPIDQVYSAEIKQVSAEHDQSDVINNDVISLVLKYDTIRDAKTYTLTASLSGDSDTKYKIVNTDATCSLTIKPCPVLVEWNVPSFVYTGSEQAPTATAQGIGSDRVPINITGAQVNAGTYTARATTTNTNYQLLDNAVDFTIDKRPISIQQWDADTFTYNGKEQGSAVTKLNNVVAGESNDVLKTISYEGLMVNASIYPYEVRAILPTNGNYYFEGLDTTTFTILPTDLIITVGNLKETYTGSTFSSFEITPDGLMGNDKIDEVLSVTFKGPAITAIDVASYEIDADVTGNAKFDNYVVTIIPGTLQIEPKSLTITLVAATKVYDGLTYPTENFEFTHSGLVSTDRIEEVCEVVFGGAATNAVNASTSAYPLTATTTPLVKYQNYSIKIVGANLKINQAPLTVTAIGGSKVYDGTVGSGFSISVSGLKGTDTVAKLGTPSYSGEASTSANVGSHKLSVSLPTNTTTRNYSITYETGTYEITPKDLTVTVTNATKTYNGVAGGSFNFTVEGLVSRDSKSMLGTPTYGGEATTNKNVGTYELTISLPKNTTTSNYNITYIPGEFVVTPKSVSVTVDNVSKTYDGLTGGSFTFKVSGMASSDTVAVFGTPYYTGTATTARNVGTYSLSVTLPGNDNYTITSYKAGTFEIKPKAISVRPTATSRVYDGTVGGEFGFTVTGLVSTDSESLLGTPTYGGAAVTAKNAGTYALTVQFPSYTGENYTISYLTGSFEIEKKALTVTAIAPEKVYDGKVSKSFSFEVDGLVDGETVAMLGTPTYSGNAVTATAVGQYTLKVRFNDNNAVLANYSISYKDAIFVISQAE